MTESELLIYQAEDGETRIEVRLQDETVWLTINQMAELFQINKSGISRHLQNIYETGELTRELTVANFATVQSEGGRQVSRNLECYSLDAIISVGYRVNSHRGTQFRIWATKRLKEYIIKGFTLDDKRLKQAGGGNYVVQHKMHWAAHGHTAAEIIADRADSAKPHMGLTSWSGTRLRKSDTEIAKNYLSADELGLLNRIVTAYLEIAEIQALNHTPMYMKDWIKRLDDFINMSGRELLENAGTVSNEEALGKAHLEYERYRKFLLEETSGVERSYLESLENVKKVKSKKGKNKS